MVLLTSSPKDLYRQILALASLCDLKQTVPNLRKSKVMIFNTCKKFLEDFYFFNCGGEMEIANVYMFLGVLFIGFHHESCFLAST